MNDNKIWIPDKLNKWIMAELVEELDDNEYMVKTVEGLKKVKKDDSKPTNNINKVERIYNLVNLVHLHEPAILSVINQRYMLDKIYTFTGPILIAVNPFKKLEIYDNQRIKNYFENNNNCKLEPHIFNISNLAYKNLINNKKDQSILISGESGAGKTISARLIMNSLSTISYSKSIENSKIEKLILASNSILESFGNAKTIRNDNSSRFGKFIKLFIDTNKGNLVNAKIETYLLEKVRVVNQSKNERNYHIFYQYLTKSGITSPYNYLNNEFIELNDDLDKQLELDQAFETLGFSKEIVNSIYNLIMGILELGNISFENKDINQYKKVADLLNVCPNLLEETLTKKKINVAGDFCISELSLDQSINKRDALAKESYEYLFNYIVNFINSKIYQEQNKENLKFIGILDIFGFEIFQKNDFEQFCINYANETLQNQFNKNIFEYEQNMYQNEGIEWDFINYSDNQECIDLIQNNKTGIFGCLDEVCRFPIGNDKKFIEAISKENLKKNKYFQCSNINKVRGEFLIEHYAGKVKYNIGNFCDKNKDQLNIDCINLLKSSSNLILEKYQNKNEKKCSNIKTISLGSQFKNQLKNLLKVISETDLHYIRCLKPNDQNLANIIDNNRMSEQLKYNGVLEAIRVARLGFPIRFSFDEYDDRYNIISKQTQKLNLTKESLQKGNTMYFLKKDTYQQLENIRNKELSKYATIIQTIFRSYQKFNKYQKMKSSSFAIQKNVRSMIQFNKYQKMKSSSLAIQKNVRSMIQFNKYQKMKSSSLAIQKNFRSMIQFNKYQKIKDSNKLIEVIVDENSTQLTEDIVDENSTQLKEDIVDISTQLEYVLSVDTYDNQVIIDLNEKISEQTDKILEQTERISEQENQISNIFAHYKQIIKDKDHILMNNEDVCDNLINKINRLLVENNKLKNEIYQLKK